MPPIFTLPHAGTNEVIGPGGPMNNPSINCIDVCIQTVYGMF